MISRKTEGDQWHETGLRLWKKMRNNSNVREGLFRFSKEIFKAKNNRQEILYKNGVEKYFSKFTGKHQYQGLILKTFLHCIVGYIL